jgi:SAM-dependent methyltransferase
VKPNEKISMNLSSKVEKAVPLPSDADALRELILDMRAAYERGENAMAFARKMTGSQMNSAVSVLIGYDLQAGSYVAAARARPEYNDGWSQQLSGILDPLVSEQSSILEVGCGEATTLAGVVQHLSCMPANTLGFDLSWSRIARGEEWLKERQVTARLYVADLFEIPLADESIDVVYTSHSIEPNGGREEEAIRELLRIARRAVVLVEPIYELANNAAKERMDQHGFVRGLKDTALRVGVKVADYRLLELTGNPLNPSGVIVLEKAPSAASRLKSIGQNNNEIAWRCPLTHTPLVECKDLFLSQQTGLVYPVLRGIPMLRRQHAVVASGIGK